MKNTVNTFRAAKEKGEKLTMVTSYDYNMAGIVDEAGINGILVGDSLGMVVMGYEDTLPVTMDDMVHHTKAVSAGVKNTLVVGDMPFMSYHVSTEDAVYNAGRLIKEGGAHCVKLEGGAAVLDKIEAIVKAQIPVMGHLGLTPQSVNMFGGFKVQGKSVDAVKKLIDDAKKMEEAGVFAIVLECVPEKIAKLITEAINVPTIGIGAGKYCDGQILVINDMLGMFNDFVPKFVKKYANLRGEINSALQAYKEEVQTGAFPEQKHTFKVDEGILRELEELEK